jgi:UDP-N-acetylmuramoyl-tripeptide--D-alanyl-D-alanine ligase
MAQQAIDLGASLAVIDDPAYQIDGKTHLVNDSLLALQRFTPPNIGKTLSLPVIGLTGSNGKTTTKEFLDFFGFIPTISLLRHLRQFK